MLNGKSQKKKQARCKGVKNAKLNKSHGKNPRSRTQEAPEHYSQSDKEAFIHMRREDNKAQVKTMDNQKQEVRETYAQQQNKTGSQTRTNPLSRT